MTHNPPVLPAFYDDDARWAAVLARDPAANAHFVYAVKTTGIYCRPGSATRLPKRENVAFFDSAAAAEAAGYRPSRRLAANRQAAADQRAALVARACRLIEDGDVPCSLEQIAAIVGVSAFHFHRLFKAQTGLTPKAYASAARARKLREELRTSCASVTSAIYSAGFNSNSRFYEEADRLLGMRASDYRAGGHNTLIRYAVSACTLGAILVASSQRGICAITLGDDPDALARELQERFPRAHLIGGDAGFEALVARVVCLVEASNLGRNLPPDVQQTAFQERVRQALCAMAPGTGSAEPALVGRIRAPKTVRAAA